MERVRGPSSEFGLSVRKNQERKVGDRFVTYKSAWFMAHRIRYAMTQEPLSSKLTGVVEIDETYIGGKFRTGPMAVKPGERAKDRPPNRANKTPVVWVLQRQGRRQPVQMRRV